MFHAFSFPAQPAHACFPHIFHHRTTRGCATAIAQDNPSTFHHAQPCSQPSTTGYMARRLQKSQPVPGAQAFCDGMSALQALSPRPVNAHETPQGLCQEPREKAARHLLQQCSATSACTRVSGLSPDPAFVVPGCGRVQGGRDKASPSRSGRWSGSHRPRIQRGPGSRFPESQCARAPA